MFSHNLHQNSYNSYSLDPQSTSQPYSSMMLTDPYQNPAYAQPANEFEAMLLAVRIMDGLFVGNAISSQDDEFIFTNKVSHIINCSALDVPNVYAEHGIHYLSFPWKEGSVILDSQDRKITRIAKFMERAFEKGECVLVHSLHGINRSCVVVAAYLIYKYRWTLEESLDFIKLNHPDMAIAPHFITQLRNFSKKKHKEFEETVAGDANVDVEEHKLLKNTYMNSLPFDQRRYPNNNTSEQPLPKKRVKFSQKLIAKRSKTSHNHPDQAPRSILRVSYAKQDTESKKHRTHASRPQHNVSFTQDNSQVTAIQNTSLQSTAEADNKQSTVSANQKSSRNEVQSTSSAPKTHRSRSSSLQMKDTSQNSSTTSSTRDDSILSHLKEERESAQKQSKPVLHNNFTAANTRVTSSRTSTGFLSSIDSNQSSTSSGQDQSSSRPQSASSSSSSSNSRSYDILSGVSRENEGSKKNAKRRPASVDRSRESRLFSSTLNAENMQSSFNNFIQTSNSQLNNTFSSFDNHQQSSTSGHRKRPTFAKVNQNGGSTSNGSGPSNSTSSLFVRSSGSSHNHGSSNASHRIFHSRNNLLNGTSALDSSQSLDSLLTSSKISTSSSSLNAAKKKVRPRSATHRKRKPTPMHQRPSSAPSQNDRMSSLENIYGNDSKKRPKSSTSSSLSTTKKKKRTKKTNLSKIESRLYNPTQSFLLKSKNR